MYMLGLEHYTSEMEKALFHTMFYVYLLHHCQLTPCLDHGLCKGFFFSHTECFRYRLT